VAGYRLGSVPRMSAPWTFGRVLSGLLAAGGLLAIVIGMFLSFISGDGDNFWGRQPVELDAHQWTCKADGAAGTSTCDSTNQYGEITDKGSSFPVMVGLLGVGMIGVSIMLRIRPTQRSPQGNVRQAGHNPPRQPHPHWPNT
jgi:hypothetical protein